MVFSCEVQDISVPEQVSFKTLEGHRAFKEQVIPSLPEGRLAIWVAWVLAWILSPPLPRKGLLALTLVSPVHLDIWKFFFFFFKLVPTNFCKRYAYKINSFYRNKKIMTAHLMTQELLRLSPCPWKAPAQLLHISITSSWLPNVALQCLHSHLDRLNYYPHFSALLYLTATAFQIISCQALCPRELKALE